jgi:glyoxylase-like metal-dependent hydrolase (beta-lactamase superfamily II)
MSEWITTNQRLAALDADVIIPGHGKIQRDKSYLTLETALIQSLVDQVRDAVKRGLSLVDTRKAVDLSAFRQRMAGEDRRRSADFDNYFVGPAVGRAYKEARGEPLGPSPYAD